MTALALNDLYKSLRTVGFTRGQVKSILPEWWVPEMAESTAGVRETALLISRRLNLSAVALMDGRIEGLNEVSEPRFKHTVRVSADSLKPATLMASSLAKAVIGAMPHEGLPLPTSASEVRSELLADPRSRIDFDALLDYAWQHGVPVIPLPNLPKGVRKMDAAAIRVGERPAIVISLRNNSKSWLSFLLAHELGHLCLGHVPAGGALVEGSISDSTEFEAESQNDAQEAEANHFAHTLLGGEDADAAIEKWPNAYPPINLATQAMDDAERLRCAPGHLVLRHAFLTRRWPEARQALNFLADDMDAQSSLVDRLRSEIDTSRIGDDLQEYVEQVTGVGPRT